MLPRGRRDGGTLSPLGFALCVFQCDRLSLKEVTVLLKTAVFYLEFKYRWRSVSHNLELEAWGNVLSKFLRIRKTGF